jgi:hypothetical protein
MTMDKDRIQYLCRFIKTVDMLYPAPEFVEISNLIENQYRIVEAARKVDKLVLVDFPQHGNRVEQEQWAKGVEALVSLRTAIEGGESD